MKLFHGWLSSSSRRVRLCFAEKGLAYESVPIDMSKQEHHSSKYLTLNPNGVVPALLIGPDQSLYESSTICEYLDEVPPEPTLRPTGPYDKAMMRNFMRWIDEKSLPNLRTLNWSLSLQQGASQWTDAQLEKLLELVDKREAMLAGSKWLAGWAYSLAHIGAVPFIARIDKIAPQALSADTHPRVHASGGPKCSSALPSPWRVLTASTAR